MALVVGFISLAQYHLLLGLEIPSLLVDLSNFSKSKALEGFGKSRRWVGHFDSDFLIPKSKSIERFIMSEFLNLTELRYREN